MSALQGIAYLDLYGFPLIFYLGIFSYALLLATAVLQMLRMRVKWMRRIPRKLHHTIALITPARLYRGWGAVAPNCPQCRALADCANTLH